MAKEVLSWDPRYPGREPRRLWLQDSVADAAVAEGNAAYVVPVTSGYIAPFPGPPVLEGRSLRGYTLSPHADPAGTVTLQSRTGQASSFSDVGLSLPLTLGSAQVGTEYRLSVSIGASVKYSDPVGPVGISDMLVTAGANYRSVGQYTAFLNTDAVGYNSGYRRGVDYGETISFYADDMQANARMSWALGPGVGGLSGLVFNYQFIALNRYTDDAAAAAFSTGVALNSLSTQAFVWNLTEESQGATNRSMLIEFFPSDNADLVAPATAGVGGNRTAEHGLLPICADEARSFFEAAPTVALPNYVDENGLSWVVRSKPAPGSVKSSGRYVVLYPPASEARYAGSFRWDRYENWLISQNVAAGANFMTGIASGLEIITRKAGGAGTIAGQWMPSATNYPWSGVAASAFTFDTDVAAYFARFTNMPGIEVRKAVNAFILALKSASLYTVMDELFFFRAAGATDMRRAFKNAARDLVDTVGAARYVPTSGITYTTAAAPDAGAGYGTFGFNPSTAAGQFAQNSAFIGIGLRSDNGTGSTSYIGNSGINIGRTSNNSALSHSLNDTPSQFGGVPFSATLHSLRRTASTGYQLKRSGSTNPAFDATATSAALANANLELGRAGSGTAYNAGVFDLALWGSGLTNTQVDTIGDAYIALNIALAAAGV